MRAAVQWTGNVRFSSLSSSRSSPLQTLAFPVALRIPIMDEEEGVRNQSKRRRSDDSEEDLYVKLSDKSVLECPICFRPLTIPVFQCANGHITCSSCHASLKSKCPSCAKNLGNIRNRAIEKVLESLKIACYYKPFGCSAEFIYSAKHIHEEACAYAPYDCPFKGCNFLGSSTDLYLHLKQHHTTSVATLISNKCCTLSVSKADEFVVFLGDEDSKLAVLVFLRHRTVDISYIQAPNPSKARQVVFFLTAEHELGSFQFRPVISPWRKAKDVTCNKAADLTADSAKSKGLLQILDHLCDKNGRIKLRIVLF